MANVYVSNFGGIKTSGFAIGLTFDDEVDATDLDNAIMLSGDTTDITRTLSPAAGSGEFESFHVIFTLPDNRSGAFSFRLTGYTIQGGNTTFNLNVEEADSTDLVPGASTSLKATVPTDDPNTDNAYHFVTADETWYSWTDDGAGGGEWDPLNSMNGGAQTIAADNRIWLGNYGVAGSEHINTEAEARTYIEDPSNNIDTAKIYLFFDVDRLKKISIITSIEIQFDTEDSINARFELTGYGTDPQTLQEFPLAAAENDGYYLVDGRNVITVPITFTADDGSAVTGIRYFSETDFHIESVSGDDISEAEVFVFATNEEDKFLLKIILPDNKKGSFQITFDGNIRREGLEDQETIFVDEPLILDFDSTIPYITDFDIPDYKPDETLYIRVKFNVPVRGLYTSGITDVFDIDGVPIGTPNLYKWVNMDGNTDEPVDGDGVWEPVMELDLIGSHGRPSQPPTDRNYWQFIEVLRDENDIFPGRYVEETEGQIFLIETYMPANSRGKLNVSLKGGSGSVIGPFK